MGCLADSPATLAEIASQLGRQTGGDLADALTDLCEAGFVARENTWNIRKGKFGKLLRFRLSDNYVRFYLKYIEPHRLAIENNTLNRLPLGWLTIAGYQFENLVVKNRHRLLDMLSIAPEEVLCAAPFFQTETKEHRGCQIDLLIQTQFNTLYACEVKFAKKELNHQVVREGKERLKRLCVPRGFSLRPVLMHVNGVNDAIEESGFFSNIINFSDFLLP